MRETKIVKVDKATIRFDYNHKHNTFIVNIDGHIMEAKVYWIRTVNTWVELTHSARLILGDSTVKKDKNYKNIREAVLKAFYCTHASYIIIGS